MLSIEHLFKFSIFNSQFLMFNILTKLLFFLTLRWMSSYQPDSSPEGQIIPCPFCHNSEFIPERNEIKNVNKTPKNPGKISFEL